MVEWVKQSWRGGCQMGRAMGKTKPAEVGRAEEPWGREAGRLGPVLGRGEEIYRRHCQEGRPGKEYFIETQLQCPHF